MANGTANVQRYVPRAAVGAAVLLLATACSSSGSGGGTAAPSSPSAVATTTAAAPATSASPTGGAGAVACGTGTAPSVSGTGPSDTAAAATQIATDYAKFFDNQTPASAKLGLLENGQKFVPVLAEFGKNPMATAATATVLTVKFTSASTADVTYNLCVSGNPALPGSAGKSVLKGGVWQVADVTLCNLVKLSGGTVPAVCA